MPEERFWKSTIRQITKLIEMDINYEKSIYFDVLIEMNKKPEEKEIESLLDI